MKLSIKYYPQYLNYSCGPIALKMVFEHLGIKQTRKKLIELCKAMPDHGTYHHDLINEVKNEELKYISNENGQIKDLIKFLEDGYPVIINYLNPLSGHEHYTVLVGYEKENKLLIFADPADGNDFCLSFSEFNNRWHNISSTSIGWYLVIGRE